MCNAACIAQNVKHHVYVCSIDMPCWRDRGVYEQLSILQLHNSHTDGGDHIDACQGLLLLKAPNGSWLYLQDKQRHCRAESPRLQAAYSLLLGRLAPCGGHVKFD